MVRTMYPGYSGYRPRIQLWHGTADGTINYNNQLEAIKEWTNVLGLGATPTSSTTVTLDNHSWTRQSWADACGVTVLDAWAEQNGPHGTDANLNATYVIPFLGLDKAGPIDPDVAACDGGSSGVSSTSSSGASSGSTGSSGNQFDGGSASSSRATSASAATSSTGAGGSSPMRNSGSTGSVSGRGSSGGTRSGASGGAGGGSTDGEGASSGTSSPGCSCGVVGARGSDVGLAGVAAIPLATGWLRRRTRRRRAT
jgi:hypothetical protein